MSCNKLSFKELVDKFIDEFGSDRCENINEAENATNAFIDYLKSMASEQFDCEKVKNLANTVDMPDEFDFISHINEFAGRIVYHAVRDGNIFQISWDSVLRSGKAPYHTTQSAKRMYHSLKHHQFEIV